MVLTHEERATGELTGKVWIANCGYLLRVAPQHLRTMAVSEFLEYRVSAGAERSVADFLKVIDELSKGQFEDLVGQGGPGLEDPDPEEAGARPDIDDGMPGAASPSQSASGSGLQGPRPPSGSGLQGPRPPIEGEAPRPAPSRRLRTKTTIDLDGDEEMSGDPQPLHQMSNDRWQGTPMERSPGKPAGGTPEKKRTRIYEKQEDPRSVPSMPPR